MRGLFCDTSFFYALLDGRDHDHPTAEALARRIEREGIPLVTTWEVVVETVTLLRYRYSYQGACVFIDRVLPSLNVVYADDELRAKALDVFRRFSREHKISLCDALSYAVVCEQLGFASCLAFDEDFRRMGLAVLTELT